MSSPERPDDQRPVPRAHARVALDAFVRVIDASHGGDRDYPFRTRDLSEGGLFLYTRVGHLYPFVVGSTLAIELHHAGQVLLLRGCVVRVVEPGSVEAQRYPAGFGVRLDPPHPKDEHTRSLLRALTAATEV
jgi:hypothetical protein